MSACTGSYLGAVRVHPRLGAAECPICGRRFDRADLAGEAKQNVPLHSPRLGVDAHVEQMKRAAVATPCAAWHLTYGGRCLNCGFDPART